MIQMLNRRSWSLFPVESIETSLDVGAQQIVEKYVNGFKSSMGAKNIGVIAMKPSTGEIIAMDGGDTAYI